MARYRNKWHIINKVVNTIEKLQWVTSEQYFRVIDSDNMPWVVSAEADKVNKKSSKVGLIRNRRPKVDC